MIYSIVFENYTFFLNSFIIKKMIEKIKDKKKKKRVYIN